MKRLRLRALAEVTIEYLGLALCVSATLLALLVAHLRPSLATPPFFVIMALAGLTLGLAISLVYVRRNLRRRYLCAGPLAVRGLWVCPLLALGRPLKAGLLPEARVVALEGRPATPKPPAPLRVLVVEDDAVARHSMVRSLEAAGLQVEATDDGAHALFILGHERPDVMVLDLMLPTLNGVQVGRAQRVLEASYGRSARIIVVTGRADVARQAVAFAPEVVLSKPVDGAQLVRAVTGLAPETPLTEVLAAHESEPRDD